MRKRQELLQRQVTAYPLPAPTLAAQHSAEHAYLPPHPVTAQSAASIGAVA